MSTDTLEIVDLNLIFKDVPECISEGCENEATFIQQHDNCGNLKCASCVEIARQTINEALFESSIGMVSSLVCIYCETERLAEYWRDNLKFLPL